MKYDEVLEVIGEFGAYQKWMLFLVCLPVIPIAMQSMITVYILASPNHRCALPGFENDTYLIQDEYHFKAVNAAIPSFSRNGFSQCNFYNHTASEDDTEAVQSKDLASNGRKLNTSLQSCDTWVYDRSSFEETLVSKFNMVCAQSLRQSHSQMVYMLGSLFGTFIFGPLGDIYGRKIILISSLLVYAVSSTCIAFIETFLLLGIALFMDGASCTAFYNVLYVLGKSLIQFIID
ncbi:organic cation transporter-like protein [Physella acuta]|uniref:organic cation transporter-like protein n=1 Tax=Physella acuta TaxID=109671 RepID=UPI0027DE3D9F|nr:organic cation transporter-like protein [Physella acuta]